MKHTIYIHGFGSSGQSDSAKAIKKQIPDLLTPTYDAFKPFESLQQLLKIVEDGDVIIASSLGGWYAERISERKKVTLVLYNPSIDPTKTLVKYDVPSETRQDYKTIENESPEPNYITPVTLILSIDDEVIYYRIAIDHYTKRANEKRAEVKVIMNEGGHRIGKNVNYIIDAIKNIK